MFAQFLAQNYLNSLPRRVNTGLNSEWSDFYQSELQKTINEQNNTKQAFGDASIDRKIYIRKCSFQNIYETILKFNFNDNTAQETLIEDCQFNSITSPSGTACIYHYNKGNIALNRNTFNAASYNNYDGANSFILRATNDFVYSTSISNCGNARYITRETFEISGYHKVTSFNVSKNKCHDNAIGQFVLDKSDCWIGFSNFFKNTQIGLSDDASLRLWVLNGGHNYELMFANIMNNECIGDKPLIKSLENANFRYCIIENNTAKFHFLGDDHTIKFIDCLLQEYKVTNLPGKSGNVTVEKVFGRIPPIAPPRPIVVYCTADAHYANLKRARQNYLYT